MRKTIAAIAAAAVLAASLGGCSSGASSSASSAAASASEGAASSTSLFVSEEWPRNETTEQVPAPKFSAPMDLLSVNEGNVKAGWVNVPESEVASFVDELKEAGFVYDISEKKSTDEYFYAANNNEDVSKCIMVTVTYKSDGSLSITATDWRI